MNTQAPDAVDVAVIDYGMGNLHSVSKALQHVAPDANVWVGSDPDVILRADRVIYPGVGAIRDCIGEVRRLGLDQVISEVSRTKPLLGICVGMQGLMKHSTENNGVNCLGLFDYQVKGFSEAFEQAFADSTPAGMKIPHMGWNQVEHVCDHALWNGIANNARFYFVHSYFVAADSCAETVGRAHYGVDLVAAIARDNIFAVQFHPEKSHRDGLMLLQNFLSWDGQS